MDRSMTSIQPLGDQAALAYFRDEAAALAYAAQVRRLQPPWLVDVVSSYASVAVFFSLDRIRFTQVKIELEQVDEAGSALAQAASRLRRVPCCYDLGPDLERVAKHTGLAAEEVISLHATREYTVYAIGFCPGFPYLGYLDSALCNVPRLESPRLKVDAGSVGLTGRQTGIYTEARPGGWNIVGRTPLTLVDVESGYFPLRTGDRVVFERISKDEFGELLGSRLDI